MWLWFETPVKEVRVTESPGSSHEENRWHSQKAFQLGRGSLPCDMQLRGHYDEVWKTPIGFGVTSKGYSRVG